MNAESTMTRSCRKLAGCGLLALAMGCVLSSCKSFQVDLNSPEPIKVDVNMRLDVYQYKGDEPGKPDAAQVSYDDAVTRQRNREAEIQTLKNNRLVGEDHRGLLFLREKPAGEWGTYVEGEVNDENNDRNLLMRHAAREKDRAFHEIQEEQWKLRTANSYNGEWIEVVGDKPGTYKWVQAEGRKLKGEEKKAAPGN